MILPVTTDDVNIMFIDVSISILRITIAIARPSCFWMTMKSFSSSGFSGRVLISCRQRTSKSWASLSRTAPRLLALAQLVSKHGA